jgi:thymidylate kinase
MTVIESERVCVSPRSNRSAEAASGSRPPLGTAWAAAITLVALIAALETEGIAYCYWKSSSRVDRAFAGQSDLDLLVARSDRQRAIDVLSRCGFKHWPDAPGRDQPALMSFLGYEESAGAIHHVHLHFRLVVGHSLLKNFHLPIEERLLARCSPHASLPIRILDSTDEALLLIVRANLEIRYTDFVALRRRRELERKHAAALMDLAPRVDAAKLRDRANEIFSPALADAIAARMAAGPRKSGLGLAMARELSAYRMYGGFEATVRGAWRSALWAIGGLNKRYVGAPRPWGRRAPGGGVLVAFVGVDGSGKSTQVAEARRWLGPEIDVLACYFGSGDGSASLFFRPFKVAARLVASKVRVKPKGASHGTVSDRPPGPLYSALFAIWALAVAFDKRTKLIAAQRAVARGFVVVTDRYPQSENPLFNDGPLLHRLPRAPAWLSRFEASIYETARRAPPDLVIKLHVGPETVARREPQMKRNIILQRLDWLKELQFSGARVVSIDATQPLSEVTRIAKRAIWDIL